VTSTLGERLTWRDGDLRMSQCAVCRHKARDATCAAFPAGIPTAALLNEISHADAIDGDQGLRLEPIEIAASLFEHITGLSWPEHAVSHDDLEVLIARAHVSGGLDAELAGALLRAELLLPRTPGNTDEGLSITTIADAQGSPHVPLFTSIPRLEDFCGTGTPRVRLTLENIPDGFGGIPVMLNPGSSVELAFDPARVRELASG
jgi:type III secretion system (T3SS) SseB-like protein